MLGLDVSNFQHGISYADLVSKLNIKFVIPKATEGTGFTDKSYNWHRQQAKDHGLICGSYAFCRPDTNLGDASLAAIEKDARAEADFFLSVAQPNEDDLLPAADVETPSPLGPLRMVHWLETFFQVVDEAIKQKAMVYTYPTYWRSEFDDSHAFADRPLWFASYGLNVKAGERKQYPFGTYFPIGGWDRVDIHQFTSKGTLPGWVDSLGRPRLLDLNSTRIVKTDGTRTAEIDIGRLQIGQQPTRLGVPFGPPWKIEVAGSVVYEGPWGTDANKKLAEQRLRHTQVIVRGTRKTV